MTILTLLIAAWLPLQRASCYHAVPSQTQGDHLTTASGMKIDADNPQRYVALSRDLLKRWGGAFAYGDTIEVIGDERVNGEWVVADCMNARYKLSIDFLVHESVNFGLLNGIKIRKK